MNTITNYYFLIFAAIANNIIKGKFAVQGRVSCFFWLGVFCLGFFVLFFLSWGVLSWGFLSCFFLSWGVLFWVFLSWGGGGGGVVLGVLSCFFVLRGFVRYSGGLAHGNSDFLHFWFRG